MAFVFVSDAHLCERNLKKHRRMTGDSIYSFSQAVDLCMLHNADLVLGGDVFDKARPEPSTVVQFCQLLGPMNDLGLKVFFIQGQHDASDIPWASVCPAAIPLDKTQHEVTTDNETHTITGLNWRPADQAHEALQAVKPTDIFVGHQVWAEFHYGVPEISFRDIHPDVKLLLVGDYHKRMSNKKQHERTFFSTGSLSLMSIDEEEFKRVLLFATSLEQPEWHTLNTRKVNRVTVQTEDELDKVMARQEELKETRPPFDRPILEVRYLPSIDKCRERVTKAFSQDVYLWLMPISQKGENGEEAKSSAIGSFMGVEEAIASQLDEQDQPLAMSLWGAQDINEELERIMENA